MRHTYDATGLLKAPGLIAASAASPTIYDAGPARLDAVGVVDISAMEIGSGDEHYEFIFQGSNDPAFATSIVNLAILSVGHVSTQRGGATVQATTGRYEVQVWNEVNGVIYRYIRLYTFVAGTIATGVDARVWLATDNI